MSKVVLDMSVSLDGIGAGPNPNEEDRMGAGGERLHAWMPFYDPEQEPTAGVPAASEVDARMVRELFGGEGGGRPGQADVRPRTRAVGRHPVPGAVLRADP